MTAADEEEGRITLRKLIEYRNIGFKVVPICEDGKTPALRWTEIYEDPSYWTDEKLEQNLGKFKNVATVFGKSPLKDSEGQDLYLNELDIDSDNVYRILFRLQNGDGDEYSLIPMLQQKTFVVKTKKPNGFRIFWLSHTRNKPVGTKDCKQGFGFEIKTDKSLGHSTLPPSRHRDDSSFHYQNFGQEKLWICDKLYHKLVEALEECRSTVSEEKQMTSNGRGTGNSSRQTPTKAGELNAKQIKAICDTLGPYYKKGFRNTICLGLSGVLRKSSISRDSAIEIIQQLAKDDEEAKQRAAVVESTYARENIWNVSGVKYFMSILVSVTGNDMDANQILSMILAILASTRDPIMWLTNIIINEHIFRTMRDSEEIYYYDPNKGVYTSGGARLIQEHCQSLYPEVSTHEVQEVINQVNRRTGADRGEFDSNIDVINLENGLLNIHTLEFREHSPHQLSLIQPPLIYDAKAKCPKILQFLGQILKPKDAFTALEFFGYCLYRTSKYQKALLCVGKGANGKSTFLSLFEHFLGNNNTAHVSLQDIMDNRFATAELYAKLANIFSDLKSDKVANTGPFKMLVSGDPMKAERKHCQPFNFESYAKLFFSANEIPQSEDKTYAYFRRWIIFFFENVFEGEDDDPNLIDKLTTKLNKRCLAY